MISLPPSSKLPTLTQVIDPAPLIVGPGIAVLAVMMQMNQIQDANCALEPSSQSPEVALTASCALVVEHGRLLGLLTERDIVKLSAVGRDLATVPIGEVMTRSVISLVLNEAQTVLTALTLLQQHQIRHLPVLDQRGHLVGLITPYSIRRVLQPANLLKLRRVSEVMTTEVIAAASTASVLTVAQLMADQRVSCIVIHDVMSAAEGNIDRLGILTERDIVQFQILQLDLAQVQAQTVMSTPLFFAHPHDSLWDAHQSMQLHRVRRLGVVNDQGELVGLLTQTHLLEVFDPIELSGVVDTLQQQVEERTTELELINQQLRQVQEELELRVQERTITLLQTNQRLQQEIQERQQAEAQLRYSQQQLTDFVENATIGMHWVAADSRILWANQAELDLLGYSREEYIGHLITEFHADSTVIDDILCRLSNNESLSSYSARLRAKDGSIRDVLINSNVLWENGKFIHTRCFTRDVTNQVGAELERQQAEHTLRETLRSLEFQKFALDRSAIVAITDRHGTITEINDQFCQISQYSRDGLLGQNHRIINSGFHPPKFFRSLWATIISGKVWQGEIKNRAKDGSFYWVATTIVPFLDDQGHPFQYLSIRFDITDRKQAEESLQQSEQKFRGIFNSTFQFVGLLDINGIVLEANRTALAAISATPADVIGQAFWATPWWTHSPDLQRQLQQAIVQAATDELVRFEAKHFLADGSFVIVDFSLSPIKDETGKVVMLIPEGRDITDRKQLEWERERFLAVGSDLQVIIHGDGYFHWVSPTFEPTLGWSSEEMTSRPWIEFVHPDDIPVSAAEETSVFDGNGTIGFENRYRHKDGSYRWFSWNAKSYPEERVIYAVAVDITTKKKMEDQFLHTQRLESLGTLASGIAHDLNNILTPILAVAQLLPLKLPQLDPQNQRLLQMLQDSSRRGSDLVNQILSFARGAEGKRTTIQAGHLLLEVGRVAKQTFPKSIVVHENVTPPDLWMVSADATQLHQVFMNLCINARDAMPEGGTLTLEAKNIVLDANYAQMHLDASEGPYVAVTIADTGSGIAPEVLNRMFEPFFTTKGIGKGTGLGLSTAMTIVKQHSGFMTVYSELNVGTQFMVYLPALEGANTPLSLDNLEAIGGNGELILLVDDEASIREIVKISLETHNYQVITACDGIDAFSLYAEHKQEVSVVILDLMMPLLDTSTIMLTLERMNPRIKVIAMSGLALNQSIAAANSTRIKAFLAKPFTIHELLKTLHQIIADG
jgi:PAS domain S-box-containing protein